MEELPSNIELDVGFVNVNETDWSAEVRNLGDYPILRTGFLYAKEAFSCNGNAQEIKGNYNPSTNKITTPNVQQLSLDDDYFIRAFVEVENPNTGRIEKICSPIFKERTGDLDVSTGFKIIENQVEFSFAIDGLEGTAEVSEYGHYWIKSKERLKVDNVDFGLDMADGFTTFLSLKKIPLSFMRLLSHLKQLLIIMLKLMLSLMIPLIQVFKSQKYL